MRISTRLCWRTLFHPRVSDPVPARFQTVTDLQTLAGRPVRVSNHSIGISGIWNWKGLDPTAVCVFTPPPRPEVDKRKERVSSGDLINMMAVSLDVAAFPSAETSGLCLLVRGEKTKYLFGRVPEGSQRAMNEQGFTLTRTSQVFLSGVVGNDTVGGLPGLLITRGDVLRLQREALAAKRACRQDSTTGSDASFRMPNEINVFSGPNLNYFFGTRRRVGFRFPLQVRVNEHSDDPRRKDPLASEPDWKDHSIQVWMVPLADTTHDTTAEAPDTDHPQKRNHGPSRKHTLDMMVAEDADAGGGRTDRGASLDSEGRNRKLQRSIDRQAAEATASDGLSTGWRRSVLVPKPLSYVTATDGAVFVKTEDGNFVPYQPSLHGRDQSHSQQMEVWVQREWIESWDHRLPPTTVSRTSMCYVVQHQPRRGQFRVDIANSLGVPVMKRSMLCRGESIVVDGKTITPEMVLSGANPGYGFIMVDIPDEAFVPSFLDRPEWRNEKIMDTIKLMIWQLGPGLCANPALQQFMRQHDKIAHFVASPETGDNVYTMHAAAWAQAGLNQIDPDRFPFYHGSSECSFTPPPESPFHPVKPKMAWKIMPAFDVSYNQDSVLPPRLTKEVKKLAEEGRQRLLDPYFIARAQHADGGLPNPDTEVIPLGTGSMMPSKQRNVSSTLIRIPGVGSYLLDCGEATIGQIRASFGTTACADVLRDLKCIVISHEHADHHLGAVGVIRAWAAATKAASDPESLLTICCDDNLQRFFVEYHDMEDIALGRLRFVGCETKSRYGIGRRECHLIPAGDSSGLSQIMRIGVDHCQNAYATVLDWPSGLRIAFSGDCRPSRTFADAARDCTLLVHEATLEDGLKAEARDKKHCTISEARSVARRMRARRVLLTHSSQRFGKRQIRHSSPDRSLDADCDWDASTGVGADAGTGLPHAEPIVLFASDLMRVRLCDFQRARVFLPALEELQDLQMATEEATEER